MRSAAPTAIAALVAAILAPPLFYLCIAPVAPALFAAVHQGVFGAIFATRIVAEVAPQVPAILLAAALVAGAGLNLLGWRHVAFHAAAGAVLAFGLAHFAPFILDSLATNVLILELDALHSPAVLAAILVAGAADGIVFWAAQEILRVHLA